MSLDENVSSAIAMLEAWYRQHCNGLWEHHSGVTIQSTDNPGWLITFTDVRIDEIELAEIIGDLLRNHQAQVSTDGTMVRVFSPLLEHCLIAGGEVLKLDKAH